MKENIEQDNIKRTYSINLIAYLMSNNVDVAIHRECGRIYGEYVETNRTVLIKQLYNEDEDLHKFLNQFKRIKESVGAWSSK